MKKIGVIGAGSWGTSLAVAMANAERDVILWSRGGEVASQINETHENKKYLKDIKLPESIEAVFDLKEVMGCEVLLLVVPAQVLRQTCEKLKKNNLDKNIPLVICCKGIEKGTHKLMSEVVEEILPNPIAVLSGPNFAGEIARGLPAGATLACMDEKIGMQLLEAMASQMFRLYYTNDVVGAQIGGAVKNVLAIACGIAIGRGLGENARATLVTRGMAEISRLCKAKGGEVETLMGLSGIGDIMLTCGSETSRNTSFGLAIGGGASLESITTGSDKVTEGVATAESVIELADSLRLEMPICSAVKDIIYNGAEVGQAVASLLKRPLTSE